MAAREHQRLGERADEEHSGDVSKVFIFRNPFLEQIFSAVDGSDENDGAERHDRAKDDIRGQ